MGESIRMLNRTGRRQALLIIGFLGTLVFSLGACAPTSSLTRLPATTHDPVQVLRNGTVPKGGGLPFRFQDFKEPQLAELVSREKLKEKIRPRGTQFEQMVEIRKWANGQFRQGVPNPYPPWNALTVLDWIRSKKTGGFCAQYSQVLLQTYAAFGFTARYLELGTRDNPFIHYVTEVWSNDFNKWVVMDGAYNLHFMRHGIPLSALEVHDAYVTNGLGEVTVEWDRIWGHERPYQWPYRTAELYYYVRFHLKADHLSKPDEEPFDRMNDMVEWLDPRTVPWESSTVQSEIAKSRLTKTTVADRSIAEAPLNQLELSPRLLGQNLELAVQTNLIQLQAYEYRVGTGTKFSAWTQFVEPSVRVPLESGPHVVEVRAVNIKGVAGPSSSVLVRVP